MALAAANQKLQFPSPLDKLTPSDLERFICLKDPKYIISEQKIKRQDTENLEAILDLQRDKLLIVPVSFFWGNTKETERNRMNIIFFIQELLKLNEFYSFILKVFLKSAHLVVKCMWNLIS